MCNENVCGMIMAVLLSKRAETALEVQKALTKHGCLIRVRLGLHEAAKDYCAEDGLILLHLVGAAEDCAALEADLQGLSGVRVKTMLLCA
jgi:hypothetical protein